jgi:hypothetical protein
MFNSGALSVFGGRRYSSQLDIPTLWIKEDDEERLTSSCGRKSSRSRRPSFEVSRQYHSRNKRRFRHYRHSLPMSTINNDPQRRTSMCVFPPTPSTVLAGSPITPSDCNTIIHSESIMLRPYSTVANEVVDELPILNPIRCANYRQSKPERGSSIVGNLFSSIRLQKGDRYSIFEPFEGEEWQGDTFCTSSSSDFHGSNGSDLSLNSRQKTRVLMNQVPSTSLPHSVFTQYILDFLFYKYF